MQFKLGDKVTVKAEVLPGKDYESGDIMRKWRRWEGEKPVAGIIVGMRTVKEGRSEYWGSEEGYRFVPSKHIRVYLVAISMASFIRVLPEDLEVAADA